MAGFDEAGLYPINAETLENLYTKGVLISNSGILYTPVSMVKTESTVVISFLTYDSVTEGIVYTTVSSDEGVPEPEPEPILVESIVVSGTGAAITVAEGATLQMIAAVLPIDADTQTVVWSVATLVDGAASISLDGILTGITAGTVTVTATAEDGSESFGELVITVTAITPPASTISFFNYWR